ncbi:hypothetical protein PK34_13740 [Stutzerimonas stutzeri]|uniref:hypothetical protein n=1 Tax=Stutzerimonas stutzeri subgroup TaxID=578833 RepID=UPI0006280AF9|nr:hypothetical protein [Stutzerimonas kunmingensis]KKJ95567.1 hypothetical protein PK34_13740 [Stutzerimonas stutzeri]
MTQTVIPRLKIQEMELPYGADSFKGRLFVGTPTCGKPRAVTAEQWRRQVLTAAEASSFKYLVVPLSFWLDELLPESVCRGPRYVHVMDTAAGVEQLCTETPAQGLHAVSQLLSEGQDLLLVSASKKIPGFIPAGLTQMSAPEIHVVKIWYPTVVSQEYVLTPFQIGYLAGRGEPVLHRPC